MITRYDPKTLKKLWGGSEARASIDGPRMAEAGDVKTVDGIEYESVGDKTQFMSQDRFSGNSKENPSPVERPDPKNPGKREYWVPRKKNFVGS
jgi:hypothetical protein